MTENLENKTQNMEQPKPRMHSYSAGLPKNFVNKIKSNQEKQAKTAKKQTKTTKKQTTNRKKTAEKVEVQNASIDVNNKNLNKIIGLNKGYRPNKNALKVMFLGGVGEIGKNMMALEYGNDIIIIDCGATFPYAEDMPGIDLVVPDIS